MLASDQKMNSNGLSATSKQVLGIRDAVFAEWERRCACSSRARSMYFTRPC
jgi:hypothetical protein